MQENTWQNYYQYINKWINNNNSNNNNNNNNNNNLMYMEDIKMRRN